MLYLELCKLLKMLLIIQKIITKDMVYVLIKKSQFCHTMIEGGRTHITNGRNVLIFGANMSFSVHATNRANHIYVMGDGFTQIFMMLRFM